MPEELKNQEQPGGSHNAEESPFEEKAKEYFDRIKAGQETFEQVLNGIKDGGPIYNFIKEIFYKEIPSSCRDNQGNPFDYDVLVEFLNKETQTTDEEYNQERRRIREAILYFSKKDQEKEEQEKSRQQFEQVRIQELRQELGVPNDLRNQEISPAIPQEAQPEITTESVVEKIELKQTIDLPERPRAFDQEVVGDLNGSYDGLLAHLFNRDLAKMENGQLVWIGGDKKLVMIGDILGDRTPEGLKIYQTLNELKKMANNENGDIVWLSGNHENMFNAVLAGFTTEFGTYVDKDMKSRLTGYAGNLELANFLDDEKKNKIFEAFSDEKKQIIDNISKTITKKEATLKIIQTNPDIPREQVESYRLKVEELKKININLSNLGNGPDLINNLLAFNDYLSKSIQLMIGDAILQNRQEIKQKIKDESPEIFEALKQQKLIEVVDDVLYVHTNLTSKMVDVISKNIGNGETVQDAISKINQFYQSCLADYFDNDETSLTDEKKQIFNKLRDIFISTSGESRVNFSEEKIEDARKAELKKQIKSWGINLVVHGHNDEDGKILGDGDLPIVSVDRSAFKSDNPNSPKKPISAGALNKQGTFSYF